jgi:hypothetical protein
VGAEEVLKVNNDLMQHRCEKTPGATPGATMGGVDSSGSNYSFGSVNSGTPGPAVGPLSVTPGMVGGNPGMVGGNPGMVGGNAGIMGGMMGGSMGGMAGMMNNGVMNNGVMNNGMLNNGMTGMNPAIPGMNPAMNAAMHNPAMAGVNGMNPAINGINPAINTMNSMGHTAATYNAQQIQPRILNPQQMNQMTQHGHIQMPLLQPVSSNPNQAAALGSAQQGSSSSSSSQQQANSASAQLNISVRINDDWLDATDEGEGWLRKLEPDINLIV